MKKRPLHTQCAICDRTRMEHELGHPATKGHAFTTVREAKYRDAFLAVRTDGRIDP